MGNGLSQASGPVHFFDPLLTCILNVQRLQLELNILLAILTGLVKLLFAIANMQDKKVIHSLTVIVVILIFVAMHFELHGVLSCQDGILWHVH